MTKGIIITLFRFGIYSFILSQLIHSTGTVIIRSKSGKSLKRSAQWSPQFWKDNINFPMENDWSYLDTATDQRITSKERQLDGKNNASGSDDDPNNNASIEDDEDVKIIVEGILQDHDQRLSRQTTVASREVSEEKDSERTSEESTEKETVDETEEKEQSREDSLTTAVFSTGSETQKTLEVTSPSDQGTERSETLESNHESTDQLSTTISQTWPISPNSESASIGDSVDSLIVQATDSTPSNSHSATDSDPIATPRSEMKSESDTSSVIDQLSPTIDTSPTDVPLVSDPTTASDSLPISQMSGNEIRSETRNEPIGTEKSRNDPIASDPTTMDTMLILSSTMNPTSTMTPDVNGIDSEQLTLGLESERLEVDGSDVRSENTVIAKGSETLGSDLNQELEESVDVRPGSALDDQSELKGESEGVEVRDLNETRLDLGSVNHVLTSPASDFPVTVTHDSSKISVEEAGNVPIENFPRTEVSENVEVADTNDLESVPDPESNLGSEIQPVDSDLPADKVPEPLDTPTTLTTTVLTTVTSQSAPISTTTNTIRTATTDVATSGTTKLEVTTVHFEITTEQNDQNGGGTSGGHFILIVCFCQLLVFGE